MIYRILADGVVCVHFLFIVFVGGGALLVLWWPRLAWIHLPAAFWGAAIMYGGWICPLTPLENHLRDLGGEAGYETGFIDHYLMPIIYPAGLTRGIQVALGTVVLVLNGAAYGWLIWRRARGLRTG